MIEIEGEEATTTIETTTVIDMGIAIGEEKAHPRHHQKATPRRLRPRPNETVLTMSMIEIAAAERSEETEKRPIRTTRQVQRAESEIDMEKKTRMKRVQVIVRLKTALQNTASKTKN
jgi:hypothetical protein